MSKGADPDDDTGARRAVAGSTTGDRSITSVVRNERSDAGARGDSGGPGMAPGAIRRVESRGCLRIGRRELVVIEPEPLIHGGRVRAPEALGNAPAIGLIDRIAAPDAREIRTHGGPTEPLAPGLERRVASARAIAPAARAPDPWP